MRVVLRLERPSLVAATVKKIVNLRERRRYPRRPVKGSGALHWESSEGQFTEATVAIRNWSDLGLQVEIATPLPVETRVRLVGPKVEFTGCTRYCSPAGERYRVGIELTQLPEEAARYIQGRSTEVCDPPIANHVRSG